MIHIIIILIIFIIIAIYFGLFNNNLTIYDFANINQSEPFIKIKPNETNEIKNKQSN